MPEDTTLVFRFEHDGAPLQVTVTLCSHCLMAEAHTLLHGDGTGEYANGGVRIAVAQLAVPAASNGVSHEDVA